MKKRKFMLIRDIGQIKKHIIGEEIDNDMVLFKSHIFEYKTSLESCMLKKCFFIEFKGKKFGDKEHVRLIRANFRRMYDIKKNGVKLK